MIHIIDKQSDEIVGIILNDEFWDDNYHRSLETTAETFEFTTFADKDYSEYLTGRNKVIIPDEDGRFRELTIWQAEKVHEHSKHMIVFTKASYNDLRKAQVIKPQTLKSKRASEVAGIILNDTEWRVGIAESDGKRTFHIEKHTDPYSMLKRIATEFNLELDFRIETKGNKITGRYVDLVQQIGQWRGREIEFGKDLRSIKRIEDTDNIYTALIGLGPEKDGRRLEVLVEDYDALQRWGRRDPVTGELRHIIGTYEPQTEKDELPYDRLRTLTKNELEKRINEIVEYEAEIADLEHVPGMENEKIRFGDTLKIKDTQFNPPLYVEARVFEVSGSMKERGKKNVKLGDFTEYTEEEVQAVWKSLQDEIRRSIARMLSVNVVSSAGTVFKNGIGSTELTAVVYNQGNETDKNGETYNYTWTKYDKHGNLDADWSASGKKLTVQAKDIDEKAMYACEVVFQDVAVLGYVTLTNVFDGTQGIPGKTGEDGRTSYFHTAYANSADGNLDFSLTDFDGKLYIGTYTDFEPNDSTDPSDYKWARFKGEQGPRGLQGLQGPEGDQGIPGKPGEDGKSSYTHIAYADDNQGGGFSQDPTGKEYMGVYVDHQPQDSNNPNDYNWSLIKGQDGEDGIPGKPGKDGRTPYFHTAYSNSADGRVDFSTTDSTNKTYIGTYTDFITQDSTNPSKYNWTKVKGDRGPQGPNRVDSNTDFADGYDPSTKETPEGAQQKADKAKRQAEAFAENASNIKEGIINVNSVPIRSSASGATLGWDSSNGLWQKNNKGEYTFQSDMQGNNRMVNAYVSGEIHAQSGTFAGELKGARGTFGHVTVKNGNFILEDDVTSAPYSATPKRNLIKDHSFELIPQDVDKANQDSINHNWLPIRPNNGTYEDTSWERRGNPMVAIQFAPSSYKALAMMGEKAIVVRNAHYVRQFVYEGVGAGSVYTVSAHFKRQWQLAGGIPRIEIWHVNAAGNRSSKIVNSTFARVNNDYSESRHATTFTVPSNFQTGDSLEVIISGGDDNWVQCDGVQMVEGEIASVYLPEDMIWDMAKGNITKKNQMLSLWVGEAYPTGSQKIYPKKKLQDCANGWILVWSRYNKGSGLANMQYHPTYIPKQVAGGSYSVEVPQSAATRLFKYLFFTNDSITGHVQNSQDQNHRAALRGVLEW